MENILYKRNSRKIKRRAIGITVMFYALIVLGMAMASNSSFSWEQIIPEPIKEWIKMDKEDSSFKKEQARA